MMKKKMISLLAAAMLTGSIPVWAEPIETVQTESQTPLSLTVEEAVSHAVSNSLSLAAAKAAVTSAQYSRNSAAQARKSYLNSKYEVEANTFEIALVYTGYYVDAAETQLTIAKRTLAEETNSLKTEVRNAFYSCLNMKNKTELAQSALANAEEKERFAAARTGNGTLSEIDLQSFRLSVLNSRNALSQAKRNEELALRSLKDLLNYPIDRPLNLIGTFSEEMPSYRSAEEAIRLSRSQNTYKNLSDADALAEDRWKRARDYYFPAQAEYSVERANYEKSHAEFQQNVRSLDTGICSAYNALLTLRENIEYLEAANALTETNTQAMYLRHEMGMVTANDYLDSEQKLFENENTLLDLKLSYYTSIQKYNALYTDSEDTNA